jgi:hypothetical protein
MTGHTKIPVAAIRASLHRVVPAVLDPAVKFDPRPARRARIRAVGEGEIGRNPVRALTRGEPVALGRVDASVFDPRSAPRAGDRAVGRWS